MPGSSSEYNITYFVVDALCSYPTTCINPELYMNQERSGIVPQVTRSLRSTDRRKWINQYRRGERIGKGKHGDVFLCEDQQNGDRQVAMKVVRRTSPRDKMKKLRKSYQQHVSHSEKAPPMSTTEHGIQREITIMKRCYHPNLVRLFEVIDDPQQEKIYIIMENLSGGPIEWTNAEHEPILLVDQTRRIIRDVIVGLDYLHNQGIIHRDIKPANLLWTENRTTVKIIDFGVSHFLPSLREQKTSEGVDEATVMFPEGDLHKRIGTPSFIAPEVVWFDDMLGSEEIGITSRTAFSPSQETVEDALKKKPPITQAIDVWSLAVTFYCLLFGHTPFNISKAAHNEYTLYHHICTEDWSVEETMGADSIATGGRRPKDTGSEGFTVISLLNRMLQKDPRQRITLGELKRHPWFLRNISDPDEWLLTTSPCRTSVGKMSFICRWARRVCRKLFGALPGSRQVISPRI